MEFNEAQTTFLEKFCSNEIRADDNTKVVQLLSKKYSTDVPEMMTAKDVLPQSRFCDGFRKIPVKYDRPFCLSIQRTIFVIHILNEFQNQLSLTVSNVSCSGDAIPYAIRYIPIMWSDISASSIIPVLSEFNNVCNTVLVYVHQRVINERMKQKIARVLEKIEPFPVKKTMYIFVDDLDYLQPPFFVQTSSKLRVVNVKTKAGVNSHPGLKHMFETHGIFEYSRNRRYDIGGYEVEFIDDSVINPLNNTLQCTWWFNRFLQSAFDCGKSRSLQFVSSCYLNSTFNLLILDQTIRKLVVEAINKKIRREPQYVSVIKDITSTGGNLDGFVYSRAEMIYIFVASLFYQLVCKGLTARDINTQLSLLGIPPTCLLHSMHMFFSRPQHGKGGNPFGALYSLLSAVEINFTIEYNGNFYQPIPLPILLSNAESTIRIRDDPKQDLSKLFPITRLSFTTDCVVASNTNIIADAPVSVVIKSHDLLVSEGFVPVACTLQGSGTNASGDVVGHAVVGFICDDVYKIYDSAANVILNFSWLNFLPNELDKLYRPNRTVFTGFNVTRYDITEVVYINTRIIPRIDKTGVVCSI